MSEVVSNVIEMQVRLDASPEVVFPYLVDAERYARWQGVRAELDPRPGGVYRVWMDANMVASGEYVEVEPHRRVVFTWGWEGDDGVPPGSTTVEIVLEPDGASTTLTLRHTGLPPGEPVVLHTEGWQFFTGRLAVAVVGRDPGPIPPPPSSANDGSRSS
ncbi:MAG: SRPBCC domain-containing protein [Actinomycetota bacterium]|nr:SRPBCC domain-containing protein [Actinomycetota bacterium]MDH5223800.1 SRPBCC domain-containing protein [Actinomycetota bacterium]MDH5313097.1 SRPBCC domain-containing protein [Actinomycetota bacterium]